VGVFAVTFAYLLFTAWYQERDVSMNVQDELMYLVQAQAVAHGHLWYPAHPMADFFTELFVINRPVYAGMYFPGTALLYATTVWFHVPTWVLAAAVNAAAAAMVYRITAELLDGFAGLLAALLMISLSAFRWTSVMVMSHPLMLLLGLLMFWCYLRWRRDGGRVRWMALMGVFAGWAAITRPLDSLAYGLPIFACVLIDLFRHRGWPRARTIVAIAVAAAPFLSLQLIQNKGVTGRFAQTPVQFFHDYYFPWTYVKGHEETLPANLPKDIPTFRSYYETFVMSGVYKHRYERLMMRFPQAIQFSMPATWVIFFVPAGLLGLAVERRYWGYASIFLAYVLLYMTFPFFLSQYIMIVAPMGILILLLGARQMEAAAASGTTVTVAGRPAWRVRFVAAVTTLWIVASVAAALPEVNGLLDEPKVSIPMQTFNGAIPTLDKPAVVFFRSRPDNPNAWKHEQVFNIEGAPIDDSPVVRAQDLGPRDIELVRYYADHQPNRVFYMFQQEASLLTRLGTAAELRDRPERLNVPVAEPKPEPPRPPRKGRPAETEDEPDPPEAAAKEE
jgi:4-amino-4-deoxy-L-arabinose transferase-like glycosyltransferase